MVLVYNLLIKLYCLAIVIASWRSEKAREWRNGRKNLLEDLKCSLDPDRPVIWFHCASLGEFEQGRPVMESFKDNHPGWQLVVTFFSPSGYLVRKDYQYADHVCYLPLDSKKNAKAFLDVLKPEKVVFVKYEFWYHFIEEIKKRGISLYVISAIFRKKQVFFKSWGGWYRNMLKSFDTLFVQNKKSAELLKSVGIDNVVVAGDTRFDRVAQIVNNSVQLEVINSFVNNSRVLVAGSTWPQDEELIVRYCKKHPDLKVIFAPHETNEKHILQLINALDGDCVRYSEINKDSVIATNVLIVDIIGILSSVYRYGHVAYIGGGFGVGIHNILEAATYGMPVVFGPNYHKFKEARDLVALKGAFPIENYHDIKQAFNQLLGDENACRQAGEIAANFVSDHVGATDKIVSEIS